MLALTETRMKTTRVANYRIPVGDLSPQPSVSVWLMPRSTKVYIPYAVFILSNITVDVLIIHINAESC